jgi:phage terminase large subunit
VSYAKAIKHRTPKKQKMHMGFSALAQNERRRNPWLGAAWFEEGMDEERSEYIAQWHKTTEEMLKANPDLVIIG